MSEWNSELPCVQWLSVPHLYLVLDQGLILDATNLTDGLQIQSSYGQTRK
jgi:hypothetical protein